MLAPAVRLGWPHKRAADGEALREPAIFGFKSFQLERDPVASVIGENAGPRKSVPLRRHTMGSPLPACAGRGAHSPAGGTIVCLHAGTREPAPKRGDFGGPPLRQVGNTCASLPAYVCLPAGTRRAFRGRASVEEAAVPSGSLAPGRENGPGLIFRRVVRGPVRVALRPRVLRATRRGRDFVRARAFRSFFALCLSGGTRRDASPARAIGTADSDLRVCLQ
jgi:hypothetical protein